jgi:hypothetical protein
MDDETKTAVLAAFENAKETGCRSVDYYMAAVSALRVRHPVETKAQSALQAVTVVLMAHYRQMTNIE